MGWRRDAYPLRSGVAMAALLGFGLFLSGCSSTSLNSMTGGLLDSSPSTPSNAGSTADASPPPSNQDLPCPDTAVRTGASTLMVGNTPGQGEPSPLDVRYQGSISRVDRECHTFAGTMHIKVGVEGRIITGPAGGPGSLNVPLRVAIVSEGINPVTVATQLVQVPVTIDSAVGHVTFTYIYPDVSFPLPHPLGKIQNYTVYVGFDPIGAQQKKRPVRRRAAPHRKR